MKGIGKALSCKEAEERRKRELAMEGKFLRGYDLRMALANSIRSNLILSMVETAYGSVFSQTQPQKNCSTKHGMATHLALSGSPLDASLPPFTAAGCVGQLLHSFRQ